MPSKRRAYSLGKPVILCSKLVRKQYFDFIMTLYVWHAFNTETFHRTWPWKTLVHQPKLPLQLTCAKAQVSTRSLRWNLGMRHVSESTAKKQIPDMLCVTRSWKQSFGLDGPSASRGRKQKPRGFCIQCPSWMNSGNTLLVFPISESHPCIIDCL